MSTETNKWKRVVTSIYRREDGVEIVLHRDNRTWFVFLPGEEDPVLGERFATLREAKEAADARL